MDNDLNFDEKNVDDYLSISGIEDKIFIEENPYSLKNEELSKLAQNFYDNQMNSFPKKEINLNESYEKEDKDISGKEGKNLSKLDSSEKHVIKMVVKYLGKKRMRKKFLRLKK